MVACEDSHNRIGSRFDFSWLLPWQLTGLGSEFALGRLIVKRWQRLSGFHFARCNQLGHAKDPDLPRFGLGIDERHGRTRRA